MASDHSNIPIDIAYDKMTDWLIQRQWAKADYFKAKDRLAPAIQAAVAKLSPDLAKGLDEHPTFFQYQAVFDAVLEKNGDTKTLFGSYAAEDVQEWSTIITKFKANNLFIVDSSAILRQLVNFDIPGLKKKRDRSLQRLQEFHRREQELTAAIASYKRQHEAMCFKLGIDPEADDMTEAVTNLQDKLPAIFSSVVQQLNTPAVKEAAAFYAAFVAFVNDEQDVAVDTLLPALTELAEASDGSSLDDHVVRTKVLDELYELATFLERRCEELSGGFSLSSLSLFQDAPKTLQNQNAKHIQQLADSVNTISSRIACQETRQLLLIRSSEKYVSRVVLDIQSKGDLQSRAKRKLADLEYQRAEAHKIIDEMTPQIDTLVAHAKDLQAKLSTEIGKLYNGRPVNIMGKINEL
eukprot:m.241218 g.241218  ORF g.241218 m.241218 type:complete len:408 (-) comp15320_c0_seq6:3500-4723(-)